LMLMFDQHLRPIFSVLPTYYWPYPRCEKHCLESWANQTM